MMIHSQQNIKFTSNQFLVLTVLRQLFTMITLGDEHLHFSPLLVTKANALEGETTTAM
jgi:hypothetical protein